MAEWLERVQLLSHTFKQLIDLLPVVIFIAIISFCPYSVKTTWLLVIVLIAL